MRARKLPLNLMRVGEMLRGDSAMNKVNMKHRDIA